ncbi:MAG: cupin domain-containing protein [Nitrospiraceae bacterium]
MAVPDRRATERKWKEQGFSCGLWVDPPGQVWEDYVHSVDELIFVLEGNLEVEVCGHTRRLSSGDELFIPAHQSHTVRNVGGGAARWLYGYRHMEEGE